MIPFNVNVGGTKVGITWGSLVWFFIVTMAATALGEVVYTNIIEPNLPAGNPLIKKSST
jgi:hypothetical protein